MQFMLVGAPSVYYGDEVGIDGGVQGDEGYRYPMPWSQIPGRNQSTYEFYQKLIALKKESKALREGGMKFLYAEGSVLALARFNGGEVYVAVMSVNDETQEVVLPLGAVGVKGFSMEKDIFGKDLRYHALDDKRIMIEVEAHQAYLFKC